MFNSRPYRHIPTADLIEAQAALFEDIRFNLEYGFSSLNGPNRRDLRRVSRELDRRAEVAS